MKREWISSLTLNPAIDRTIVIDDFFVNSVNRVKDESITPGSKGINVAKTLAQCGMHSLCFGLLGGESGTYIEEELKKIGVVSDFVRVDYPVRTNIKVIDLKNTTCTDINFDGGMPSASDIDRLMNKTKAIASISRIVAIGGSLPPGVEDDLYYKLALVAMDAGAKVTIDCTKAPLVEAVKANPFIIKPNLSELEESFGFSCNTYDQIIGAATVIYQQGVENVLVSLGSDGAIAVCGGDVWRVYADEIPVYSTVGAGDAFLSGFIYAYDKGMNNRDCLKHALSFSQVRVAAKPEEELDCKRLSAFVETAKCELLGERVH